MTSVVRVDKAEGGAEIQPEVTSAHDPGETYANGCPAWVVEVDIETGLVMIEQMVAVEDCGTQLNPVIVKEQVAGAVAKVVGIALLEDLL